MTVPCPFCGADVDTRQAEEVYVPQAVTGIGTTVHRLAWAHPGCVPSSAVCSLCDGEACEEGCGNLERSWCRRSSTGAYGPDAHRVCRRCGDSGTEQYGGSSS